MKKLCLVGLFFYSVNLFAQEVATKDYTAFMADANGRATYELTNYVMEGTPFFPPDYYKATIVVKFGKTYTNILAKLNLYENQLYYKATEGGADMVPVIPIKKVKFGSVLIDGKIKEAATFETGFKPIEKYDTSTFYEVLDSGNVQFLKHYKVSYNDQKPFGSATVTRVFDLKKSYYLCLADGSMHKLEKGKEAIVALLTSKKAEVLKYIDAYNLKCKNEDDWQMIIEYYNSLFK